MRASRNNQRGAALILVLLLVATLSFIAIAMGERTGLAASRSFNARARSEMLWRISGVEALAEHAIEASLKVSNGKLTRTNPLVAKQIDLPMEGGIARLRVIDRTRCFNINSLVAETADGRGIIVTPAVTELGDLLTAAGADVVNAEKLAASVIDWIDSDNFQEPNGAEDSAYTILPAPYRTGSRRLADITELRAIAGVDRIVYAAIRPLVCTLPNSETAPINLNMLTEGDAPLVSAMTKGEVSAAKVRDVIEARPPEGYLEAVDFWNSDAFADVQISEETRSRGRLSSRYLEVNATIEYYEASLDVRLLFEVDDNGRARLLSRRLGSN